MRAIVDSHLRVTGIPGPLLGQLQAKSTCANPAYKTAVKQGRSTWRIPQTIEVFTESEDGWIFPRGLTPLVVKAGVPIEDVRTGTA